MTNLNLISRRLLLTLAIGTLPSTFSPVIAAEKNPVVVELYTSQGCSSCPPADKILGELTKNKNVIPLTFNVDYWDYLGWRDTLGSNKHTQRQKAYAANRGSRQIYTPQMVVNGHLNVVGSRRNDVFAALKSEASTTTRIPVKMTEIGDEIIIDIAARTDNITTKKATIWVIVTSPKVEVPIARGENTGKKIVYHNVVRQMVPVGMWDGKKIQIKLPKAGLDLKSKRGCVALLQEGNVGKVIGAASISMLKN